MFIKEIQNKTEGDDMYELAELLFPINRSLTGDGVRTSLRIIKNLINIEISEVPSNSKVFDWVVPREWKIRNAWIVTPDGDKICDYSKNNLHLVGYSSPINKKMGLAELNKNLFSLNTQPNAIPYVTSYYKESWGFCITHNERLKLKEGQYEVFIDSEIFDGNLSYGELIIPGKSKKEILLSTYICHPSMANNELSGPVLAVELAKMLLNTKNDYTYRIIFVPETIGSLVYIKKHYKDLKRNIIAGFVLTCVGDNNNVSYLESRYGNTLADKVAKFVLKEMDLKYISYTFLDRGSDERQYCSPGIDLPVCSVMRSKYATYPEYHTSLDNMSFISKEGLQLSFDIYRFIIKTIELNFYYESVVLGEPQLGTKGLYPLISKKHSDKSVRDILDFIAYADGSNDLIDISNITGIKIDRLSNLSDLLIGEKILKKRIRK